MKSISTDLAQHIQGEHTTLAWCALLHRTDGVVHAVTSHDKRLVIAGQAYRPFPGLQQSATETQGALVEGSSAASWSIAYDDLSEADLLSGRYDQARLRVFLVNWQEPDGGALTLMEGFLGQTRLEDGRFEGDVLTLASRLVQPVGDVTSPTCRADLGDRRCGVWLRPLTDQIRVTAPLVKIRAAVSAACRS